MKGLVKTTLVLFLTAWQLPTLAQDTQPETHTCRSGSRKMPWQLQLMGLYL